MPRFVRSFISNGLLGTSAAAAYLATVNPVVSPIPASDPLWSSKLYKKRNPSQNTPTQDTCIKRIPIDKIRPELLRKEGDLAVEFCRGVWSGWGYAIQRKYLDWKYRSPSTAHNLWTNEDLALSTYDKGSCVTDHFEVLEKTTTSIILRAGDSPRNQGLRSTDGLFIISATVDKEREEVELQVKSCFFPSQGDVKNLRGSMPGWMNELHQWYSRILSETGSWRLLK